MSLVIIPHNGAAMAKAVELAHQAGIPVLSYDRLITGCDLDLYMTFDNVKVGELQATIHRGSIARRSQIAPRPHLRREDRQQRDALQARPGQHPPASRRCRQGSRYVHEDWAEDWKPENAKKIANAAITKFGHNFDAILASNDGTAGGAIQALIEEGLAGKIIVTGQDADLAACQRIVHGTQTMTDLQAAHPPGQSSSRGSREARPAETHHRKRRNRQWQRSECPRSSSTSSP